MGGLPTNRSSARAPIPGPGNRPGHGAAPFPFDRGLEIRP